MRVPLVAPPDKEELCVMVANQEGISCQLQQLGQFPPNMIILLYAPCETCSAQPSETSVYPSIYTQLTP